jgi:hypothetical protein
VLTSNALQQGQKEEVFFVIKLINGHIVTLNIIIGVHSIPCGVRSRKKRIRSLFFFCGYQKNQLKD